MSDAMKTILFTVLFLNSFIATAWASEKKLDCSDIPFAKCIDTDIHEGRITVPLDWFDKSDSRQIDMKYRIIGYRHTDRPFLFLIGGGPAASSLKSYMLREWHYGGGLADHYRLVVFDQRGTGESSPLERGAINLTPEIIGRYFSQRQIVRDIGHMIASFGRQQGTVIMAHSAGGFILSDYLANPEVGPRPVAAVYANSTGGTNPSAFLTARFKKQIQMNHELMSDKMKADVIKIRERIRDLRRFEEVVPEGMLDARFGDLKEKGLAAELAELASDQLTLAEFVKKLRNHAMVNYTADRMVSTLSAIYFDGRTDLEWAELNNSLAAEEEEWMLLERRYAKSIFRSDWTKATMGQQSELDIRLVGRRYSQEMPSVQKIRENTGNIPVLSLVADQDQYVDPTVAAAEFRRLFRNIWVETLEGGNHYSSQRPEVAPFIVEKLAELIAARATLDCQDVLAAKIADTSKPWPYPTGDGKPWYEVK